MTNEPPPTADGKGRRRSLVGASLGSAPLGELVAFGAGSVGAAPSSSAAQDDAQAGRRYVSALA